jgi:hypothetical protein
MRIWVRDSSGELTDFEVPVEVHELEKPHGEAKKIESVVGEMFDSPGKVVHAEWNFHGLHWRTSLPGGEWTEGWSYNPE